MLILSRVFAEATSLPGESISYGMQRFTVTVLSFLLTAAAYLPLAAAVSRSGGSSPVVVIADRSKLLSGFLGVLISVFLLFCAAGTGLRSQYYASSTVFDSAPSLYFYFFTGAALLFAVYKGLEVSSRAATAVAAVLAFLLLLMICALLGDIRLNRLYPVLTDDTAGLAGDVIREFSKNSEYLVFAVLCGNVSGKKSSCTVTVPIYLGVSCAAVLLMTFLYNTVFGRLASRLSFPFYTLSTISDITLLHRINGIDTAVWVMAGILRLALYALAFGSVVRSCFAGERAAKIAAMVFAALSLGLSALFTAYPELYEPIRRAGASGIPLAAAAIMIPAAALLCGIGRKAVKQ